MGISKKFLLSSKAKEKAKIDGKVAKHDDDDVECGLPKSPNLPPCSNVPDRPSVSNEDPDEERVPAPIPIRHKSSLKAPRSMDAPQYTLKIPIDEDPDRRTIRWSHCKEYIYDAFNTQSKLSLLKRLFCHPMFCFCCVLPYLMALIIFFLLWPTYTADRLEDND